MRHGQGSRSMAEDGRTAFVTTPIRVGCDGDINMSLRVLSWRTLPRDAASRCNWAQASSLSFHARREMSVSFIRRAEPDVLCLQHLGAPCLRRAPRHAHHPLSQLLDLAATRTSIDDYEEWWLPTLTQLGYRGTSSLGRGAARSLPTSVLEGSPTTVAVFFKASSFRVIASHVTNFTELAQLSHSPQLGMRLQRTLAVALAVVLQPIEDNPMRSPVLICATPARAAQSWARSRCPPPPPSSPTLYRQRDP